MTIHTHIHSQAPLVQLDDRDLIVSILAVLGGALAGALNGDWLDGITTGSALFTFYKIGRHS